MVVVVVWKWRGGLGRDDIRLWAGRSTLIGCHRSGSNSMQSRHPSSGCHRSGSDSMQSCHLCELPTPRGAPVRSQNSRSRPKGRPPVLPPPHPGHPVRFCTVGSRSSESHLEGSVPVESHPVVGPCAKRDLSEPCRGAPASMSGKMNARLAVEVGEASAFGLRLRRGQRQDQG